MQYKKPEAEVLKQNHHSTTGTEIAFKIMLTTMVFAILVTYFTK